MIGSERIAEITEALQPLGPVEVRRMFGGAGVYLDGRIFAMILDDALYAKSDAASDPLFDEAGCPSFIPSTKDGRTARMPYRLLPDDAQRPGEAMLRWALLGMEAAERAPRKPARRKAAGADIRRKAS